jgi:hypothetical protein
MSETTPASGTHEHEQKSSHAYPPRRNNRAIKINGPVPTTRPVLTTKSNRMDEMGGIRYSRAQNASEKKNCTADARVVDDLGQKCFRRKHLFGRA